MKLVSIVGGIDRLYTTYCTDLSAYEFIVLLKPQQGDFAITNVVDINPQEAQRWEALGHPTLYRRNIPR
jgi:hypothetical protein